MVVGKRAFGYPLGHIRPRRRGPRRPGRLCHSLPGAPAASSIPQVHRRASTRSFNFRTDETEKSGPSAASSCSIDVALRPVRVERAERTLLCRCAFRRPPSDGGLPVFPSVARHSPPMSAHCESRRCSVGGRAEGLSGLGRCSMVVRTGPRHSAKRP